MNGCSYLDKKTGKPLAWMPNHSSRKWHELNAKGHPTIIVEEPLYKNLARKYEEK